MLSLGALGHEKLNRQRLEGAVPMRAKGEQGRDMAKESRGWLQICVIMALFPALFFLCVYFPIWVGWTPRFP